MSTQNLVYLPVADLYPHPDNPRKDIGDVTELADSIRANGIYQNLTVVPRMVTGELTGAAWQKGYTVIIGHRRLAASKLAGLREVPCVISNMTLQEQLRTMLMENMQRTDLTVYEQAQGFQLMLDLGETVESIAKDSGFSQSTVRRRVKLIELDAQAFKESEARGATLKDYMELDKLDDPKRKNEALNAIGTPNFQNTLKRLRDEEKGEKILARYVAELEAFAERVEKKGDRDVVRSYFRWNDETIVPPPDAELVGYYYTVSEHGVTLYRDHQEEIHEETEEEREKQRRKAESERIAEDLKVMRSRHFELRAEFIENYRPTSKHFHAIARFAARAQLYGNSYADKDVLGRMLDLDTRADDGTSLSYSDVRDQVNDDLKDTAVCNPVYVLLATAYAVMDGEHSGYYTSNWSLQLGINEWVYRTNDRLDMLYDFLMELGYQMSDEERAMMNGSHSLLAGLEPFI